MDPSDTKGYLDNATRHLVEAQSVCYECSLRIQVQTKNLSQWQTQVNKIKFIGDCTIKQCQFLYDNILHIGIEDNLIQKQWGDDIMSQLTDQMRLWQGRIDNQMKKLESTPNLLASTGLTTDDKEYNLADYITQDNVYLLRDKIQEIPNIEKHINNIRIQYNELNKKVKDKLIDNRLRDLQTVIKTEFNMTNSDLITLLEIYPRELIEAENDLGSILISLTTHFDRCKLLCGKDGLNQSNSKSQANPIQTNSNSQMNTSISDTDYLELLKIVKKDNDELPSILTTIFEIIDDVEGVLAKSGKLLDQKKMTNNSIKGKITKLLNDLTKYNEYLNIFQDIANLISNFKKSCQHDIETIKELFEFYEQFQQSYKNLLKESKRRNNMALMMENILQECDKKLKTLEFDDLTQRQKFLEENGNFLPGNIWPNEIDDFTPLYSMNYSVRRF
ncbi:autophagy-related protein 17 [Monosporozyma unispora]|nr:autophagy protein 17 [Kazachstania unispora]